jgi:2-alkyl-3-oxoalkanoate reductase
MNVFVAGATGVGGQPRYADLFDAANLVHAMKGADVVIHAATAIPTKPSTSAADWQLNDRIRREGTEALARSAGQVGAKTFIFQSIVWVANPPGDEAFDETSQPHPTAITQSALDGEGIVQELAELQGFAAAVIRCGMFYAADAGHTRMFARGLAQRRLPIVGGGRNFFHCLHADDAAGGFVAAAEAGRAGLWHLVDNEPVPVRDFLSRLAELIHAPAPRKVPTWLARLIAGRASVDFLTQSTRTSNARFRRDFNWSPTYPTFREGLAQILAAWDGKVP